MSDYMMLLLISLSIPLLCSFWPGLKFYLNLRALSISIILIVLIFGAWDVWATYRGHWSFNPNGVWKYKIINLPIEEVLFFVVIPFCCIFTWEAINFFKRKLQ